MPNGNGMWRWLKVVSTVLGVIAAIAILLAGPVRFGTNQVAQGVTIQQHEVRLTSGEIKDIELDGKCQNLQIGMAKIEAQVDKIDTLQAIMEDVRDSLRE